MGSRADGILAGEVLFADVLLLPNGMSKVSTIPGILDLSFLVFKGMKIINACDIVPWVKGCG